MKIDLACEHASLWFYSIINTLFRSAFFSLCCINIRDSWFIFIPCGLLYMVSTDTSHLNSCAFFFDVPCVLHFDDPCALQLDDICAFHFSVFSDHIHIHFQTLIMALAYIHISLDLWIIYLNLQINNRIAFIAPIKNALHVQSPFVFWSASLFGIRMPLRCQADIAIFQCFWNHKYALCYTPLLALYTPERYCQK